MSVSPNTAFYQRLQWDALDLVEIIDLTMPGGHSYHYVNGNAPLWYTLSGAPTEYTPFRGGTPTGISESNQMDVSVINFTMENSGQPLTLMLANNDFRNTVVSMGRVFISTPDLGRMSIYDGQMGDFTYDRLQLTGQARNLWKSYSVQWPYIPYKDTCGWRFGGAGCGIDANSYVTAISSIVINSSDTVSILVSTGQISTQFRDGRLDFGKALVTYGVNSGQVRTIRAHTGDLIKLAFELPYSDLTSMQLQVFPGCRKRLIDDCHSFYHNSSAFLGFPWIIVQERAF